MSLSTVRERAQRRCAGTEDESGFVLVYVLFVTMLVMVGTAAMLSVAVGSVRPARESQDTFAASAASQSGIQDYLANLNAHCRTLSIQSCEWLTDNPTWTGTIGDQTYSVRAVNPENYLNTNQGTVRIVSTGKAGATTKVLTADLSGNPSVLRFAYFSNYETLGTRFLNSYFNERDIKLTGAAAAAAGFDSGTSVHWYGTTTLPTNGYGDSVCDALYYSTTNPVASGRATAAAGRPALTVGSDFSESGYTRTPTQQALGSLASLTGSQLAAASTPASRDAACEVNFSKGMNFNGPVYSRDAIRVSNGDFGSTTGPTFTVPAAETLPALSTAYAATSGNAYRSDPVIGGTPVVKVGGTVQSTPVQTLPVSLSLPTTASPKATCTYSGPTRVVLSGATATVSSPLTPAVPGSACFSSTGTGSGSGVVSAKLPITRTTIAVKDSTTSTAAAPSFPDLVLGSDDDITPYDKSKGDAYVGGKLTSGRLSLVASNDIVVTGDLVTQATETPGTTNGVGEPTWSTGGAVDLVAVNNVRAYHPVKCAGGLTAASNYCPNDISGLYTSSRSGIVVKSDGTLRDVHPSKQYVNSTVPSSWYATANTQRIDAAVIALNGSLLTDNFNRGSSLGTLRVNGGVYVNHRGATGQLWEAPTVALSNRPSSGYKLQINYVSYTLAGLPYVPVLDASNPLTSPWSVLNISTGGTP